MFKNIFFSFKSLAFLLEVHYICLLKKAIDIFMILHLPIQIFCALLFLEKFGPFCALAVPDSLYLTIHALSFQKNKIK